MKHIFILAAIALLTACDKIAPPTADQCLRTEIFRECLKLSQQNLSQVHLDENGDGIGDTVRACENAAYYQSLRAKDQIRKECTWK